MRFNSFSGRFRIISRGMILVCLMALLSVFVVTEGGSNTQAATAAMTTSSDGIALITQFEGCRLTAYDDLQPSVTLTEDTKIIGTLTIGYGHTGSIDGVEIAWNTTITQAKAEELLAEDLLVYETAVNNLASDNGITFTQNQFDALVSFTYNVGQNKWTNGSTFRLKTYIENGIENYTNYEITSAFVAFNTSGGNTLNGLTRRRKAEAAMFLENPTISYYGAGSYIVFADSLNVRSGAGSSYSKVTTLSEGDTVTITETNGYWGKYSDGWISLDYCLCLYGSLDTPELSSISVTNSGIKVTWEAVEDAAMYRIFRKTASGSWTKVADTTSLSYTDKSTLSSNTTYYYTVRCVTSDGKYNESSYDSTGLSAKYFSEPTLTGISNTNSGIKVKWDAVTGAVNYRVYRMDSGSDSWTKIADTTSTSYTDTTVSEGQTYYYTVRCMDSTGKKAASSYNTEGLSILRVLAPELSSVGNVSSGIKIKWNASANAVKYRVYRKTSSSGSWTKVADTTSLNYTDTSVSAGTTYYYTVRAYSSDGDSSSYDSTGLSLMRLVPPVITKISNTSSGVKLTWNSASNAAKYRIYRKTSSSDSWTKLADTTSTSYTDKTAKAGKTYYYSIKTINSDGKLSATADSVDIVRLTAPSLTKISNTSSGIKLTWSKVSKATKYRVYRKTSKSGSWKKLADTTSANYTDKTAKAGKTYYYTVRAYSSDGSSSAIDSTGLTLMRLVAPEITKVKNTSSGVKVTWNASTKAVKYRVYRKTSSTAAWVKIGTTTSTSYTDKTAKSGKKYYYTVKAVNSSGKLSATATSVNIVRLSAPSLTKVSSTSSGVKVTWGKVTKATKYAVYRKSSKSGSWTKIGTTTSTSYTDKTAKSGKTYYYTVRAYSSDGSYSTYDSTGLKIKYSK